MLEDTYNEIALEPLLRKCPKKKVGGRNSTHPPAKLTLLEDATNPFKKICIVSSSH